jgi:hypothetical protein
MLCRAIILRGSGGGDDGVDEFPSFPELFRP